jgi:hypothetical protein
MNMTLRAAVWSRIAMIVMHDPDMRKINADPLFNFQHHLLGQWFGQNQAAIAP